MDGVAPGDAKEVGVSIYSPCFDNTPYEIPGACGIGGARFDLGGINDLVKYAKITVVADGFPERSVTVTRP